MSLRPYEVIVIGSGATGGVAAMTLAEAGIRVLVIEAGSNLSVSQAVGSEPANTFNRIQGLLSGEKLKQAQHPGYWKANPLLYANERENQYTYPEDSPFLWTQGNQVGGRSLTWGGITLRLSNHDLKAARKDFYGPEWPINYADLDPHYSALEDRLKIHGNCDGLDHLPDGVFIEPLPLTPSEEAFANIVRNKYDFPVIQSRGFGPYSQVKGMKWPRSSSVGSTLKVALKTDKVELLSDHIAEHLLIDSKSEQASGIVAINKKDGSRIELNAKLVVLCGSTIQSLKLLLNSESTFRSKGFIEPSGTLGKNLMDHISTCRFFSLPLNHREYLTTNSHEKNVLSGAGSFLIPLFSPSKYPSKNKFIRNYGLWGGIDRFEPPRLLKRKQNSVTGFLIGHGEVLPNPNNNVSLLNKSDKWGIPIPHIECKWGDNELLMAEHMNKTINQIVLAAGGSIEPLKELIKMPFIEPLVNKAIALQDSPPPPGYYIHEVGGAPMGTNEESSVVDNWNRLWRCKNVLVVDGACWPTSSWQSPTLTMMAITRRACLGAIRPQND